MNMRSDIVVKVTRSLAGLHPAMILGDLGARVTNVEKPDTGDGARLWGLPRGRHTRPSAQAHLVSGRGRGARADVRHVLQPLRGGRRRPRGRRGEAFRRRWATHAGVLWLARLVAAGFSAAKVPCSHPPSSASTTGASAIGSTSSQGVAPRRTRRQDALPC